eukprot:2696173-Alexandrium_andersonii.AAC.1
MPYLRSNPADWEEASPPAAPLAPELALVFARLALPPVVPAAVLAAVLARLALPPTPRRAVGLAPAA